jgi:ketosteroid isomerase-like protein
MEHWELSAREAVRHTIASYTYAADSGHFDDVAALFAPDGVLEVHGIGGAVAEGRDAILGFFQGVGGDVVTTAPEPADALEEHVD